MLNGRDLGNRIKANLDALSEEDRGNRDKVFEAMGQAIVDYFQENAEVMLADLLLQAFSQAQAVPQDGGASLKMQIVAFLQSNPQRRKIR